MAQHNSVGETMGRRRPGRTSQHQPLWARPCSCNGARGFSGNTLGKAPCQEGTWGSVYPAIPGTCFAMGQSLCTHWHAATLRAQPFSAWPAWWGQSSSVAAWCRDHPLAVGSATGDSAPTVLHTLQPTLTCAWLFIAGTHVDLDQVEDNKVIFRFISQLVKGNRLCWLRQALPSLSGHSQVLGRVTPMVGLEKGHSLDTMRAQRMQKMP